MGFLLLTAAPGNVDNEDSSRFELRWGVTDYLRQQPDGIYLWPERLTESG
jgi:hypothetical protein